MVQSSLTSAPGSFFTSSSTTDPSGVRYAPALYIMVSALVVTFATFFTTSVPFSMMASILMVSVPMSTGRPLTLIFLVSVLYPT